MTFYKVIKFPSYQKKKKKKKSIFSQGQNNCREKVYLNLVVRNIPLIHHLKKKTMHMYLMLHNLLHKLCDLFK